MAALARPTAADGGARQLNVGNPLLHLTNYSQWKLQGNATQGLPIGTNNARRKAVAAPIHHCRLATQLLIPPSLRPNLSLDLPLPTLLCSGLLCSGLLPTLPDCTTLNPRDRSPRQALPLAADQNEPKGSQRETQREPKGTLLVPAAQLDVKRFLPFSHYPTGFPLPSRLPQNNRCMRLLFQEYPRASL